MELSDEPTTSTENVAAVREVSPISQQLLEDLDYSASSDEYVPPSDNSSESESSDMQKNKEENVVPMKRKKIQLYGKKYQKRKEAKR